MLDSNFDWNVVDQAVNKKRTKYEYETSKHLFRKVAFDQFKPLNGSEQLWELRDDDDGKQYLFALYNDAEDLVSESSKEDWNAVVDSDSENVTVAFKKVPVHKISLAGYNYTSEDANSFASFIVKKANDEESTFVKEMLASMSDKRREVVSNLIKGE